MAHDTVKVLYSFRSRATFLGEMEVPLSLYEGKSPDDDWTGAVEKYISENHNFISQPPEIDFEFEGVDFDDVEPISDYPVESQ